MDLFGRPLPHGLLSSVSPMWAATALCLCITGLCLAISAQLDRPKLVFIFALGASSVIYNLVDRGNEQVGWLTVPVLLVCLPGIYGLIQYWREVGKRRALEPAVELVESADQQELHQATLDSALPSTTNLLNGIWIVIALGGISAISLIGDAVQLPMQLLFGGLWGVVVLLGWSWSVGFRNK
jgi:hypothetical protein